MTNCAPTKTKTHGQLRSGGDRAARNGGLGARQHSGLGRAADGGWSGLAGCSGAAQQPCQDGGHRRLPGHPRLPYLCRRNVRLEADGGAATTVRGVSMQQLDAAQHHARPRRPAHPQQSRGAAPVQHAASGGGVRALSNDRERAVLWQVDQQLPAGRRRRSTPVCTVVSCRRSRVACGLTL